MYICPGDRIRQLEALEFQETRPSEHTSSPTTRPALQSWGQEWLCPCHGKPAGTTVGTTMGPLHQRPPSSTWPPAHLGGLWVGVPAGLRAGGRQAEDLDPGCQHTWPGPARSHPQVRSVYGRRSRPAHSWPQSLAQLPRWECPTGLGWGMA